MEGNIERIKHDLVYMLAAQQASLQAMFQEQLLLQRQNFEHSLEEVFRRLEEGDADRMAGAASSSQLGPKNHVEGGARKHELKSMQSGDSVGQALKRVQSDDSIDQATIVETYLSSTSDAKLFGAPSDTVLTPRLDLCIGVVITLHIVSMTFLIQSDGYATGTILGLNDGDQSRFWSSVPPICAVLEHVFYASYIIEFAYKLYVYGCAYFRSMLNMFDFLLVVIGCIDLYIVEAMQEGLGFNLDLSALRFVRFLRVIRALRIIKAIMLFYELRVLIRTIYSCTSSLATCMILLGVLMLLPGILISQLVIDAGQDDTLNVDLRRQIHMLYGNVPVSTYTFFKMTMSGCWPTYVSPLVDHASSWYLLFFVPYITFVVFAVIRIITALFLKTTMDMATTDSEMVAAELLHKKEALMKKLRNFFDKMDDSGDGLVTLRELEKMMRNQKVKSWLNILGLEVHETKLLFHLLAEGNGYITVEDFLKGVSRLKGSSRAIETEAMRRDIEKLLHLMSTLCMKSDTLAYALGQEKEAHTVPEAEKGAVDVAGLDLAEKTHSKREQQAFVSEVGAHERKVICAI